MIESNLDFYLEEISESTRNTNRVKELRAIKNNQIFYVRQHSTQRFYQYRIDKIGQHKAYLRCVNYKCCSRLEVILGLDLKTEKVGNNFQFHELKKCSKIQTIIKVSITNAQRNVLVQIKNAQLITEAKVTNAIWFIIAIIGQMRVRQEKEWKNVKKNTKKKYFMKVKMSK